MRIKIEDGITSFAIVWLFFLFLLFNFHLLMPVSALGTLHLLEAS
jgi:hypothetical protein